MFRVFHSDSPLLAAINIEVYKNPLAHGLAHGDGRRIHEEALLLIASMDLSSKDNYLDWVYAWKVMVNKLSELNHILKRPKYVSALYGSDFDTIRMRTLPIISADFTIKMSDEEALHDRWNDRREEFLAWSSKSLTALYNARMTGKLATSHIHLMNRLERAGGTCGEMLARSLMKRAA